MNQQFARDVLQGLSEKPKYLSSKYFYDQKGDALFQGIMALDEYYLTRTEYEIFESHKQQILDRLQVNHKPFDLIEFGAGNGLKTKVLLKHFKSQKVDFTYKPIDISQNVLDQLESDLKENLPELSIQTLQGEYFEMLSKLPKNAERKKVVLFLGSNIGNFIKPVALDFLKRLAEILTRGDHLLLGVDLKKDPKVIASAYNDSKGVTAAFNLNLLERINRELGGNFDLSTFVHRPTYNPSNGEARSFLVSNCRQTVTIEKLDASFHFEPWETIAMELSQKYDLATLEQLADHTGFRIIEHFFDRNSYFTDTLFTVD
ncbi:MAG: L-histidine N(alpha)-methyltransferase [Cyclobacteriaceae bacterium]|nr:L-histidine N(alpha)-methyltransferase [Cyclobacteriaceae bacterium]